MFEMAAAISSNMPEPITPVAKGLSQPLAVISYVTGEFAVAT